MIYNIIFAPTDGTIDSITTDGSSDSIISITGVSYAKLSMGNNLISISADDNTNNYYLYCEDAGTYTFTANSSNAHLGYEETDTTTWVDETSFSLKANAGEVLFICCSNQDFSDETYNLMVTYNN